MVYQWRTTVKVAVIQETEELKLASKSKTLHLELYHSALGLSSWPGQGITHFHSWIFCIQQDPVSVSVFRRTLLGYYAEGMHANF